MSSSKIEAMRAHRKVEIQVPTSAALAVRDESRKIQKPARSAKPVIIYMVSPKVIHVEASEFMSLVQRLTGPAGASTGRGHGDGGGGEGGVRRPLTVKAKASSATKGSGASGGDENYPSMSSAKGIGGDISPTLYFHDLSPPSNGVRKDGAMMCSPPRWLLHGDFLDQSPRYLSESALVSSSSFMDMLNQLPEG